jgi:hypothetical protein
MKRTAIRTMSLTWIGWLCCGTLFNWLIVGVGAGNAWACQIREPIQPDMASVADFAMPATSLFYVELTDPAATLDLILNHELTQRALEFEQIKLWLKSPEMAPVKIIVGTLEEQLQQSWPQIIGNITRHGAALAWDQESKSAIFVSRAASGESLQEIVKAILGWVNLEARLNKRDRPYESKEHRNHRIIAFPQGAIARVDNWFLAGQNETFIRKTMDRLIDGPSNTNGGLASLPTFQRACQMQPKNGTAWAYLDLKAMARAGMAKNLFAEKSNMPLLELLFGGVLESIPDADFLTASLTLNVDNTTLEVALPRSQNPKSDHRQFFFALEPEQKKSFLVKPDRMIARLVSRRDMAAWWLSKENLYDENVIAQMALVDSQFTTVLSGMNFGEDFLSAFEPCLQLIVVDQEHQRADAAVNLPAFALVGRLKEPTEMKRRLRIAFNSVIGFANIQGGMDGMPPLDFMTESLDGVEVTAATYVVDSRAARSQTPLDISPSIAFADDFMIVSSTKELASELGKKCLQQTEKLGSATNLLTEIDAGLLSKVLQKNREQLIVQNMLEDGHDRKTAEQNIAQLFEALELIESFSSQLEVQPEQLKLKARLEFRRIATSTSK